MRGRYVRRWHPESPGVKVVVWCPWWKRKSRPFATLGECLDRGRLRWARLAALLDENVYDATREAR